MGEVLVFVFMDSLAATIGFFGFTLTSVGLFGLLLAFFGFAVRGRFGFASQHHAFLCGYFTSQWEISVFAYCADCRQQTITILITNCFCIITVFIIDSVLLTINWQRSGGTVAVGTVLFSSSSSCFHWQGFDSSDAVDQTIRPAQSCCNQRLLPLVA